MEGQDSPAQQDDQDSKVAGLRKKHKPKRDHQAKAKGRYGFDDYQNAETFITNPEGVTVGQSCPGCHKGKLYPSEPRRLLQFTGCAPVEATRHQKNTLRCNCCSLIFMNHSRVDKWTNSARSAVAIYKTSGVPFYRIAKIQAYWQIPVARTTLWQQCADLWNEAACYIYYALAEKAAQCNYFNVDDTRARILDVTEDNKQLPESERRACNTTVVSTATNDRHKIVLYLTDNKHCGENFGSVLAKRSADNSSHYIKIMSDASTQNIPHINEALLAKLIIIHCLGHGRRKFFDLLEYYPNECDYFLGEIAGIYHNDKICKENKYTDRKRLKYHKQHSRGHIGAIYSKIHELFAGKQVEPNSALGKVMKYWLNHKETLTKFLCIKGVELDNGRAERLLKEAILQRKNSLFFKTKYSAAVLSGLTGITKTCWENGINPYAYLNWIQENYKQVAATPEKYLPWCYNQYIDSKNFRKMAA